MSKPMEGINVPAFTEWLERLESGEEVQGMGYLHETNGSKCCLGVASCMFADRIDMAVSIVGDALTYDGYKMYLPVKVADFLGIPEANRMTVNALSAPEKSAGIDIKLSNGDLISQYNDSGDYDFQDIAEILRKEFLECDD